MEGHQWCYNHRPDLAEERKRNGRRGGVAGGRGRPRTDIVAIKKQLQYLADGILDGSVVRADGTASAQVLNYLLGAIKVEMQIRDQIDHDERITALEEKAKHQDHAKRSGQSH